MSKVYSLYLGKEIEIPQKEFIGDDGEVVKIIPSQTLEDIITNDQICRERGVRRRFTQLTTGEPGHYAFICAIYDDNRYVEAVGEALPATLNTKIAMDYPVLMASKRAFGEAAVKFLGIPKAMSDSACDAMAEMDGNLKSAKSAKVAPTAELSDEAFAALQEAIPPDILSLDEALPTEEPPQPAPTSKPKTKPVEKPAEKPVEKAEATAKPVKKKEPEVKPAAKAEEPPTTVEDPSIFDTTIVTAGKLKGQNLSVRQAYEKDADAIRWIVNTMVPRVKATETLQKICADFLKSIGDGNG